MPRPLFSDMLVDRRRQLGLSIKQASNVLRLKEEVLIAFEEGDFDSIPKSGYAQGMLSSYARYLGLNAKTVVNQFSTDLFEHERGSDSHEARRRSRLNRDAVDGPLYETPQATALGQSRGNRTYVESHGFLPTSGGFAGDMGDFATTSAARPRYSSNQGSSRDEVTDVYPQGRPYTSRVPLQTTTSVSPLGQSQRQWPTSRRGSSVQQEQYGYDSHAAGSRVMRDEVTTRRVVPSQYHDDMRLDNEGRSYEAASTATGRRSSRNIANTQRPNVRRRSNGSSRAQLRNRDNGPNRGGVLGLIEYVVSDSGRMLAVLMVVLCVALTGIIIFSVGSCVRGREQTRSTVDVTPSETEQKQDEQSDETSSVTKEEEERARAEAAAAKAAETETTVSERTFEVTVAEGEVTWIEIEYDGNSDVAETVTGPWNRTYTVRQSISISVNDTSAVTVTENGKKLEFDTKSSGIGTISIQVAKKSDAASNNQQGTDDASAESQDQQKDQGTGEDTSQQSQESYSEGTYSDDGVYDEYTDYDDSSSGYDGYTLGDDGNYYGAEGYYDQYGNYYEY